MASQAPPLAFRAHLDLLEREGLGVTVHSWLPQGKQPVKEEMAQAPSVADVGHQPLGTRWLGSLGRLSACLRGLAGPHVPQVLTSQ